MMCFTEPFSSNCRRNGYTKLGLIFFYSSPESADYAVAVGWPFVEDGDYVEA